MKGIKNFQRLVAIIVFFNISHIGFGQHVPDQDLKKNISPIQNALLYLQQLEPKKFEYNNSKFAKLKFPAGQQYGFMAEEVQRVLPELVHSESRSYMTGKNTYQNATVKNTDLESLIPLLVAAIKEQQQQIEQLKRQVKAQQK